MIHFQCPYCLHEYHDDDLFEQEHVLIEIPTPLKDKFFTLTCPNCFELFELTRTVSTSFTVQAKHE